MFIVEGLAPSLTGGPKGDWAKRSDSSRNLIEQSSEIRGNDNNGRKLKNSNVFDDYIYM